MGQEKWHGPETRSLMWQSPGSVSPGNLFAVSGRTKGQLRTMVSRQPQDSQSHSTVLTAPSSKQPPSLGFLPSKGDQDSSLLREQRWTGTHASSVRCREIHARDRGTAARDSAPSWVPGSTAPSCIHLYTCLLCLHREEHNPPSPRQQGVWQ